MLKSNYKNRLVVNSFVELGDDLSAESKGKGRKFVSKFIEPGLAHYEEFGDVLITKDTFNKFIQTMVGCPVIIRHKDITDKNADKERVGVVSNVWFNEDDGWFYCDGIIWDKQAIDLVKNQGWNVSCTYDFESDKQPKTHNGKKIDMEFTDGEFLHLALVPNPRYERANIVVNSKDIAENEDKWITIKPNGEERKGRHLLVKDGETPKEAVERVYGKKEDKEEQSKEEKWKNKWEEIKKDKNFKILDTDTPDELLRKQKEIAYLIQKTWEDGYENNKKLEKIHEIRRKLERLQDKMRYEMKRRREQTAEKTSQVQNSFDTVLNAISEVFVECLGELRAENKNDGEKWTTIKPHGAESDDYKRLKLQAGETSKLEL